MGNKDYNNFNKSYSTDSYHSYEDKNSEQGCFKVVLAIIIILLLIPSVLFYVYVNYFHGEKSYDDFYAKYILGKNIDEERNDSVQNPVQNNETANINWSTKKKIVVQNPKTNQAVSNSESEHKVSVRIPTEQKDEKKVQPNQISNISQDTKAKNDNSLNIPQDTIVKRDDSADNSIKSDEKKELSDSNSKELSLNDKYKLLTQKRVALTKELNDLGNKYKEKVIELNSDGSSMKSKEFQEYEVNYKKEINRITKEIELNIKESEKLNNQIVAINNQHKKAELINNPKNRIVGNSEFERRFGISHEKEIELKNKIDQLYKEVSEKSRNYNSMSETELLSEYETVLARKKEIIKEVDVKRLSHHIAHITNFDIHCFIHVCMDKDYSQLMEKLIENGFSPDNWGFGYFPTVFYVTEKNSKKCLEVLLKHDVNLKKELEFDYFDRKDGERMLKKKETEGWFEGKNLLHSAAQVGNLFLAQKVLESGVPVNKKTKDGKSPLYFAVKNNQYEMAEFLLKNGVIVDEGLKELTTNKEMIGLLEKASFPDHVFETSDEDKEWREAYEYIVNGKLVKFFELYQKGKDLSKMRYKGVPAPCIAVKYDKVEIIKFLIHEYDCNKLVDVQKRRNALHYAVLNANNNIVKLLLENGFDPNMQDIDGNTSLHLSIVKLFNDKEHNELIDLLLSNQADVNKTNNQRQTPLHIAIEKNNYNSFSKLSLKGVNLNKQDMNGNTPLHYAVNKSSKIILSSLIKAKANIDSENLKGQTPLHLAVINDDVLCAKLLLENNADVNKQDMSGNTPLHYLALFDSDNKEMLDEFMKYKDKFNISLKNKEGKTPCNVGEINPFMSSELKAEN